MKIITKETFLSHVQGFDETEQANAIEALSNAAAAVQYAERALKGIELPVFENKTVFESLNESAKLLIF